MTGRLAQPIHFTALEIRPALVSIGLWSRAAEQLLLATAIQESRLFYRRQINGPALGFFQMEPRTHDDIWTNFLAYRKELASKVEALMDDGADKLGQLERNDRYAAAMARVHYYRYPDPIPELGDIEGMAELWKRRYNGPAFDA
jgi:hypothetical protein